MSHLVSVDLTTSRDTSARKPARKVSRMLYAFARSPFLRLSPLNVSYHRFLLASSRQAQ